MLLYRVCPVDPSARPGSPYHPGFVPRSRGVHRVDNPELYDVLYVSGSGAGAIAEAFGMYARWGPWMLDHPRGYERRLVALTLTDSSQMLDLDDSVVLTRLGLRPSRVVTRNRPETQEWAARIHSEGEWAGVSWWSFYDPDWVSAALWCPPGDRRVPGLTVASIDPIEADHPDLEEAAATLHRSWEE